MTTFHHRAAIYESDRSLVGFRENDLSIFKRSDTLNSSLFSSRRISSFQTRSRVGIKLNSNARRKRACSTRADETRIINTKHNHDPVVNYPFIDRSHGKLAHGSSG